MKHFFIAALLSCVTLTICLSFPVFAEFPYEAADSIDWKNLDGSILFDGESSDGVIYSGQTVEIPITGDMFGMPSPSNTVDGIPSRDFLQRKYFQIAYDKGSENSRLIQKIKVVSRIVDGARLPVVQLTLRQTTDDNEYLINPTVTFTTQQDMAVNTASIPSFFAWSSELPPVGYTLPAGSELVVTIDACISTPQYDSTDDDVELALDTKALVKTGSNNSLVWLDDDYNEIAALNLRHAADRDTLISLSTEWHNRFNNIITGEAYLYTFAGRSLPSGNRLTLDILNPFYDTENDVLTVPLDEISVYQIIDKSIIDISGLCTATENNNGQPVIELKVSELSTFIITDGVVAERSTIQNKS